MWVSGNKYEGEWCDDQIDGSGTLEMAEPKPPPCPCCGAPPSTTMLYRAAPLMVKEEEEDEELFEVVV